MHDPFLFFRTSVAVAITGESLLDLSRSTVLRIQHMDAYRAIVGAWSEPVILACSGGIDSTALLVTAAIARDAGSVAPFTVAHVDHRTRPGIEQEAAYVSRLCTEFGVPFLGCRVPIDMAGASEDALRSARYDALGIAAERVGASIVVTAHTWDDQVETILMRLFTGASPVALAGMQRVQLLRTTSGALRVLRPLLTVSRLGLMNVLDAASISAIEDPSNQSREYRRNAVRHDIIPAIDALFPGFGAPLQRAVSLAAQDAEELDRQALDAFASLAESDTEQVRFERLRLRSLAPVVVSRVVRLAARSLQCDDDYRELTYERTTAVVKALGGRSGTVIELPYGIRVRVTSQEVVFDKIGAADGEPR